MKHIISFLAIAVIAMGNFTSDAVTKKNSDMPVKTDKYGFYSVQSCPTSLSFLKVTTNREFEEGTYNVYIYRGKELSQSFNLESTSDDLHFFDANFDGDIDIMVGPAASCEFSSILLWDDSKGEFVASNNYLDGNFMLNPTKEIFVGQRSDYHSKYYTRYMWHGQKLVPIESLVEINDSKDYAEQGVKCHYTLIVGDKFDNITESKTYETDNKSKLPEEWLEILAAYDM